MMAHLTRSVVRRGAASGGIPLSFPSQVNGEVICRAMSTSWMAKSGGSLLGVHTVKVQGTSAAAVPSVCNALYAMHLMSTRPLGTAAVCIDIQRETSRFPCCPSFGCFGIVGQEDLVLRKPSYLKPSCFSCKDRSTTQVLGILVRYEYMLLMPCRLYHTSRRLCFVQRSHLVAQQTTPV